MSYYLFDTMAAAEECQDQIAKDMGLPKYGVNAKTGEPDYSNPTIRWCHVVTTTTGKYAVKANADYPQDYEAVELTDDDFPGSEI